MNEESSDYKHLMLCLAVIMIEYVQLHEKTFFKHYAFKKDAKQIVLHISKV